MKQADYLNTQKEIELRLSRCTTWASVRRRFASITVREFSQCGRCLEVKAPDCEQVFIIRDGAHNIFSVGAGC